ncbi:hypothetical protein [Microvirga ossetica]|nr:hypothetical protein [Microvirga ossetica]
MPHERTVHFPAFKAAVLKLLREAVHIASNAPEMRLVGPHGERL